MVCPLQWATSRQFYIWHEGDCLWVDRLAGRPGFPDQFDVGRAVCRIDHHCRRLFADGNGFDPAGHQPALRPNVPFAFAKLSARVTPLQRCIIAYGNTDEIFTVASNKQGVSGFSICWGWLLVRSLAG